MPNRQHYFLETARLGFRVWTTDDLPLAALLWGDPRATRLIGGPFSGHQIRERVAKEITTLAAHRVQFWPVYLISGDGFVGVCGFRPHKPDEHIFELGYAFLEPYWGQGFATESARAVLSYARAVAGAKGFFAGHHPENFPSKKILEKLGFRFTHRELYPPTGEIHLCYSLDVTSLPAPDRE